MIISGKWRSKYRYSSGSRDDELVSEHVVVFEVNENQVIGKSVADVSGSELTLELVVEDNILTGIWTEKTSPTGDYKGALFHGALQLILSEDGNLMTGKWVGYNSSRSVVKVGDWEFTKVVAHE